MLQASKGVALGHLPGRISAHSSSPGAPTAHILRGGTDASGTSRSPVDQDALPRLDICPRRDGAHTKGQGPPQGPTIPCLQPAPLSLLCHPHSTHGVLRGNSLPGEDPGNKPDPKWAWGQETYINISAVYMLYKCICVYIYIYMYMHTPEAASSCAPGWGALGLIQNWPGSSPEAWPPCKASGQVA